MSLMRKCLICGKEFIVTSKKPNQKFCSKECAKKGSIKDLSGKVFEGLTVVKLDKIIDGTSYWICKCNACGNLKSVRRDHLKKCKSCGCVREETIKNAKTNTLPNYRKITRILTGMKNRCYNSKCKSYKHYGEKGICVCDEWQEPMNFYKWAINNGYEEGLTIERIDVNENYCPENCCWIPKNEQSKNRSQNIMINLKEVCRCFKLPYKTIFSRIKYCNWSIEKALTTPIKHRKVETP